MAVPEWSTKPYKGGPPVDLPGFPRALYPPDVPESSGYEPSSKGPDVVAYKRCISRAGRWPWQKFDDGYWNDFAHGEHGGADVDYSGVAGFQRQQGIQATGWLGKSTFENLRYALVPEGRQHSGEHVMDAVAQDLLIEAWNIFHAPPAQATAPQGSSAQARIAKAKKYVGVTEYPAGSNRTEFGAWYGMDGEPWCAMFVAYCDQCSGNASDSFKRGQRYAYVPYMISDARSQAYGLKLTDSPKPGDVVVFDWEGDGTYDHTGIFELWTDKSNFQTIEGNTSIDNNSNGGEVMRRSRSLYSGNPRFIRVAE